MQPAGKLFLLMGVMFAGVWAGFLLLRGFLDLSLIRERLSQKEGLTKENCLFVFAYIIVVNSFLEEAFFRGFLGHAFPEGCRSRNTVFAALCFAVYHIGILDTWVSPVLLVLMTAGLAGVGAVLQIICDRFGSMKASWLVHGCANFAINTIGAAVFLRPDGTS
jgi:membrane protease YdiL (CAAX protease family)